MSIGLGAALKNLQPWKNKTFWLLWNFATIQSYTHKAKRHRFGRSEEIFKSEILNKECERKRESWPGNGLWAKAAEA